MCAAGNVFFLANSKRHALRIIGTFFSGMPTADDIILNALSLHGVIFAVCLTAMIVVDIMIYRGEDVAGTVASLKPWARWLIYYTMTLIIILSAAMSAEEFVYAKF